MKKKELVEALLELKILLWSALHNKEFNNTQRNDLRKVFWKKTKESLKTDIEFCKMHLNDAYKKLEESKHIFIKDIK